MAGTKTQTHFNSLLSVNAKKKTFTTKSVVIKLKYPLSKAMLYLARPTCYHYGIMYKDVYFASSETWAFLVIIKCLEISVS